MRRRKTRTQIEEEVLRSRRVSRTLLLALVALSFAIAEMRSASYRRALYDAERTLGVSERMSEDSDYQKMIGRRTDDYHKMRRMPRYRHFWDNY